MARGAARYGGSQAHSPKARHNRVHLGRAENGAVQPFTTLAERKSQADPENRYPQAWHVQASGCMSGWHTAVQCPSCMASHLGHLHCLLLPQPVDAAGALTLQTRGKRCLDTNSRACHRRGWALCAQYTVYRARGAPPRPSFSFSIGASRPPNRMTPATAVCTRCRTSGPWRPAAWQRKASCISGMAQGSPMGLLPSASTHQRPRKR